jgi:hypothetical protein
MIIIDCEQYSDEWWQARLGIPTASGFDKLVTGTTCNVSSSWRSQIDRLVAEKIRGKPDEGFTSEWTKYGTKMEPEALDYYRMITGNNVNSVGLIYKDNSKEFGCSPDGLVYEIGKDNSICYVKGLEIKCPSPSVHISYLISNDMIPPKYRAQVYGSMWITGLPEWDFLSYHPDMKPYLVTAKDTDSGYINYSNALTDHMFNVTKQIKQKLEQYNKL